MNRIYQGKVRRAETLGGKNANGQPQELPLGVLWLHHELFQDVESF
jgi:hypothetical protein